MLEKTPQQVAEFVRDALMKNDAATKGLGMNVLGIGPGHATLTMTVRADMLNGHAICHGGFISTLADSAFAFACNSYDELTVASGFAIDFLAPGRKDDLLTARCIEISKTGRTGVYDADVVNQRGERIAIFRGRSFTLRGKSSVTPS